MSIKVTLQSLSLSLLTSRFVSPLSLLSLNTLNTSSLTVLPNTSSYTVTPLPLTSPPCDLGGSCDRCGICANATLPSRDACVGVDGRVYGRTESDCPAGSVAVSSIVNSRFTTRKMCVVTPRNWTATMFAMVGESWGGWTATR